MSSSPEVATPRIAGEARRSLADAAEMLQLRLELAQLELSEDVRSARRLAVVAGSAATAVLVALSVLTITLTSYLDRQLAMQLPWVSLGTGAALLIVGSLSALLAYRNFRHNLVGFRESLAELHEDAVWLREIWDDASSD